MQTYEKIAISVKATHQIMRLPGCFCVFFKMHRRDSWLRVSLVK